MNVYEAIRAYFAVLSHVLPHVIGVIGAIKRLFSYISDTIKKGVCEICET